MKFFLDLFFPKVLLSSMFASKSSDTSTQSRMTSRHSSVVSNTSSTSSIKPPLKAKPSTLQGTPISSDQAYLNEDFLEGEDEDDEEALLNSPKASRSTRDYNAEQSRLVIAIDYGTTFTGEELSHDIFTVLTTCRCCICFSEIRSC